MIELAKAKRYADRLVEILSPYCEKIDIAGSIRRERYKVGDIEIVALPKKEFIPTELFGEGKWKVTKEFTEAVHRVIDNAIKGNTTGRYMQATLLGGITMDLFMPQPHDYYRILAIRTGSDDYAHKVIANSWVKGGWVGTDQGLRRRYDCSETPAGWKCIRENPEVPPVWGSEEAFFEWLEIKWIHPTLREMKKEKSNFQHLAR
jgi:DNA polymerase/3'-5' exonuclease PolX